MEKEKHVPVNRVVRIDGSIVYCHHDGAPCPRCYYTEDTMPNIWKSGFFRPEEAAGA